MIPYYELINSYDKPARNRIVENFSGRILQSDWFRYTLLNGTGAGAMADEVDGGYTMNSTATGGVSESITTFNDIRQFNHLGASFICSMKSVTVNNTLSVMGSRCGFKRTNSDGFNAGNFAAVLKNTGNVNYRAYTASSASGTNSTDTNIYQDTDWHIWKGELNGTSYILSGDGVQSTTSTTKLPTLALQPFIYHYGYQPNAGSCTSSFNYYEAWNH